MACKKGNYFPTKKEDYQFQVARVSYPNLKKNKTFKEKFDNGLSYKFDSNTPKKTRKTLKQDNTHVINFIMSYKNRSSLIFKVLGVVVY